MRYGIFSDIHANWEALESVLRAFKKENIDSYFCVGDVVGYGANPGECIKAVQDIRAVCVAGNHDWAVVNKTDIRYFNAMAKAAVEWTKRSLNKEERNFLEKLELVYRSDDFILVHGTLQEPQFFHYLIESIQAKEMFALMDRNVSFVGHSHMPGIFIEKGNRIQYTLSAEVTLESQSRYIVNVGSVGQPRDGNPKPSYCIFDTKEKTISIKRINYLIEEAQKKIIAAGLPVFLASRLAVGR